MNKLEEQIRQICTYYSEYGEGTAGYCLSEEQFGKLFAFFSQTLAEWTEEIIGEKDETTFITSSSPEEAMIPLYRNALRAEQRQRLEALISNLKEEA